MKVERLKVKEAILAFNDRRPKGVRKMTPTSLGRILFPDLTEGGIKRKIGDICNGYTNKVDPDTILAICRETGVDVNFLYNYKKEVTNDRPE